MSVFESINNTTDKAQDLGENYLKYSHKYIKLKIFQQISFSITLFAKVFSIGCLLVLAFLFLAISGSIAIGDALGNVALGYLIIGGVLLLLAFLTFLIRSKIERLILRTLSEKFFN